jgi:hypothetical protein
MLPGTAMVNKIAGIVTITLTVSRVFAFQASPNAPWFGVWELDIRPPASRFEPPPYKRATTRIEPWDGAVKVTYDLVRIRGGITHMEWVGRFDGADYPVQGVDNHLTNAYRVKDERSYEIVIKIDSKPVATATAVVSSDGETLTVTTEERDPGGQLRKTTAVYRRK